MSRALVVALLLPLGCAAPKKSEYAEKPSTQVTRTTEERPRSPQEKVELRDTLPDFLAAVQEESGSAASARRAWAAYEAKHDRLLSRAGVLDEDPAGIELKKLAGQMDDIAAQVKDFSKPLADELSTLIVRQFELSQRVPDVLVALVVSRGAEPFYRGVLDRRPVLAVNARSPRLQAPGERMGLLARELFRSLHEEQHGTPKGVGPLALRVWRDGACALAARQLAPDAREHEILGLPEGAMATLRQREPLMATELLSALDSANANEAARFFESTKDPILPRGAGAFLADRVYQRLVAELGSGTKPLALPADAFLPKAKAILASLAAPPPVSTPRR